MVKYDPIVIQKFANGLYRKARDVVISHTILGVLFGAAVGFGLPLIFSVKNPESMPWCQILAAIMAFVFGVFGYSNAQSKVFTLKLTAQLALCQVKIEANTRPVQAPFQITP